jgi:hypothetical protein
VSVDRKTSQQAAWIERFLERRGMEATKITALATEAADVGRLLDLKKLLRFLEDKGSICVINDHVLHSTIVSSSRSKLLERLSGISEGLTVAEFRDLIGGNRRTCLLLLARYESEGIVERVGDRRVITDRGRSLLGSLEAR